MSDALHLAAKLAVIGVASLVAGTVGSLWLLTALNRKND